MCQVKCPKRALTVFFALLSVCLSAQQVHTVKVESSGSRTPLVVTKGISTIQLEGLEPGKFYLAKAVPAGEAQKSELSLSPVFSEVGNNSGPKMRAGRFASKRRVQRPASGSAQLPKRFSLIFPYSFPYLQSRDSGTATGPVPGKSLPQPCR